MAGTSDYASFADSDSSLNQPKSNAATRKIISIPEPTEDHTMSNSCSSDENSSKNSTDSISNARPNELIRKRKLVEDSSCIRQAPKRTLCEGNICSQCLQLDFEKAAKAFKDGLNGELVFIEDVGHRYRQPIDSGCQLCLILSASQIASKLPAISSPSDTAEEHDGLYAYSFLTHSDLHNMRSSNAEMVMRLANDSLCLAVLPKDTYSSFSSREPLMARGQSEGHAVMYIDKNRADMFAAQVVPSHFDPAPVRIWLDYCKRHHKTICPTPKSQPHGLQLINCETLAIQDAVDDDPYVALSYVWGSASNSRNQVQNSSCKNSLPLKLPPVISDAISVTKALGFRYLWIDKFCIDQTNADTKNDQIQQMDAIYENAQLTIIAAAGADEKYGLPGVGTRPRTFQPTARVGNAKVVWTMRDPHNSIRSSKWFTRGWTFQEAILSHRRLVFTEEQVYFECNAMNCFESIQTPLKMLHIKNKSKMLDSISAGVFGRNENQLYGRLNVGKLPLHQLFAQYLTTVEEYSARELSYDQDSLDAFKGITRQFSKRKILSIWGLSYPASTELKERESYFVDSLAWNHTRSCWEDSGKPRRRPEFPSWSWAGWAGKINYEERDYTGKCWSASLVRFVALENQSRTLTTLYSSQSIPEHDSYLPRVLCIEAMAVPQNLISYDEKKGPQNAWAISGCRAWLFLSCGPDSEARFYQEIKDGYRWQCIVVGKSILTMFIMVLETHIDTDVTSRAGLFVCEPPWPRASIELFSDDKPEWRTYRIG